MDHKKLDLLPNIEHVIRLADMLNNSKIKTDPLHLHWNLDQKADFYLGMLAAMRVFQSALRHMETHPEFTMDDLNNECVFRTGEIANIIMDKYQLHGFKV